MPAVYELKFIPSGQVLELCGSRGDWYELEDGSQVEVWSKPVYCRRCADFTDGESIEGLDVLDRELADLQDPNSESYRMTADTEPTADGRPRLRPLFLGKMRQRRRWLESRVSPPKCLGCGSTDLVLLPEGQKVTNPNGPGWVILTVSGLCSTWFNNRFYTPEGDRIARDTEPTYWSLP